MANTENNQGVAMAMKGIDYITEITDEVYNALCEKYGEVNLFSVEVSNESGDIHEFTFAPITSQKLALANKLLASEQDINGYNDAVLYAGCVSGKNTLKSNDELRRSLYKHVDRIITSYTATVKKRKRVQKEH